MPNVICGVVSILLLYTVGKRFGSRRFGALLAAFLGLSLLPGLYFRSGILDPWYNLFTIVAAWLTLSRRTPGWGATSAAGLSLGLAILTKGPAAGLVLALVFGWRLLSDRENVGRRIVRYAAVGVLGLLPIGLWLLLLWRNGHGEFAGEFLSYQWRLFSREDAGHGGFPGFHAVVLLLGCFPASAFALPALFGRHRFDRTEDSGMRALFWTVLLLFSIVNTKIVHYSSLAYFPLAWFAARWVSEPDGRRWPLRLAVSIQLLYGVVVALAVTLLLTKDRWIGYLDDAELTSRLELPVSWSWIHFLPALCAIIGTLLIIRLITVERRAWAHLGVTFLFSLSACALIVPGIQRYSQGAAVDFFREWGPREVYLGSAYYRTYAPNYYSAWRRVGWRYDRERRFHGPIERPLYFASPLRKTETVLREVPDAELLYRRGGYSFYRRPANQP